MPLDEEALHGADRQRPIDVAAAAGPLARGGADVRAHRRDRVRLARQDVPLLEPALGGEVQVAAAVRPDRAGFLALDVALQPGGVDGLDEEFLGGVDGQVGVCLSGAGAGATKTSAVRRRAESTIGLEWAAKTRERAHALQQTARDRAMRACQPCTKVDVRADPQLRWPMGGPPALGEERDRMESATG